MFLFTGGRGADEDLSDQRTRNVGLTVLHEGAVADDDHGPVRRLGMLGEQQHHQEVRLGALEGLDQYGRAFSKKFPYYFCVAGAMDGSHGIELGSRARLGTRPSGTWVVCTHPVATAQPPGTAGGGLLREF